MSDKKTNMKQLFCSFVKRDVYFAVSKNPILPQFPTKYIENIYLSLSEKWYIHPDRVFVSTGWDNEVLISFSWRKKTTAEDDIERRHYACQVLYTMYLSHVVFSRHSKHLFPPEADLLHYL